MRTPQQNAAWIRNRAEQLLNADKSIGYTQAFRMAEMEAGKVIANAKGAIKNYGVEGMKWGESHAGHTPAEEGERAAR